MNKERFLSELKSGLSGLSEADAQEQILFYSEMIDDRMEEGMTEEEAVAAIGDANVIAAQTTARIVSAEPEEKTGAPKRSRRPWEIVLIVLGFPVWFPLLAAAAVVVLSLFIVLWALILSLWAVEVSLCVSVPGAVALAAVYFMRTNALVALMALGAGAVLAGLSIFGAFGCLAATKGAWRLTKSAVGKCGSMFGGKGR